MLISGALIREGRLVQNGSNRGEALIGEGVLNTRFTVIVIGQILRNVEKHLFVYIKNDRNNAVFI